MFCVPPPSSCALQPLPLPLPPQVRRAWNSAMPEVDPVVGATILTMAWALALIVPGLAVPLFVNTIVTPPVVSFGHSVEVIGGVVAGGVVPACGGAFSTLAAVIVKLAPPLKTYTPGQRLSVPPDICTS